MRIGVVSRSSPDYLIDIVADGLIRLLGRDKVSLDYNMRSSLGGMYSHLGLKFEGPEPFDIREADALVASSRSVEAMRVWRKSVGHGKPIAFIEGEDCEELNAGVFGEVKVYFKREYMKGRAYPAIIRPLPFAAIPEELPVPTDRSSQVFFMGTVQNHPFRAGIARTLDGAGFKPAANTLVKGDYNRLLGKSLIGVSVRGAGWDTYRYWEVPYFGALLLSQRLQIVIPSDFVENKEAVFFDDAASLQETVQKLLADPSRLRAIAQAGHQACMNRHLSTHRARMVLEAIA